MENLEVYLKERMKFIDRKLKEYTANNEPLLKVLQESVDYSLFAGGKRIRPLFCLIVGEIFNLPKEKLASVACALEMVHAASLIMDDLPCMDDAKMRRGKPANHIVYGDDTATLAVFGLLMKAFEIVADDTGLSAENKAKVSKMLSNAVGINGMVGGQFVDLKFSNKTMEHSTLEYIHNHKTGALFVASGVSAAIVGEANSKEIKAIEEYASNIGFAFQVIDDLLDLKGKTEEIGKTSQSDSGSFAILYGEEKSKKVIQESTGRAIEAIKIFQGKNDKLIMLAEMLVTRKT